MKKTIAIMIGMLVLGFAFAAAQTTEEPKEPTKTGVASQVKNAGALQPKFMHRVQFLTTWVDTDADGIQDEGEVTTSVAPKGDVTALSGTGAKTWDPYTRYDEVVETTPTDATTVSDIDLNLDSTTTAVDSTAVTLTKSAFRKGLSATGLTEGAGVPKGPAVRVLAQKGRG